MIDVISFPDIAQILILGLLFQTARLTEQTNVSQLEKQEHRIEAELATVRMNSHNAERSVWKTSDV